MDPKEKTERLCPGCAHWFDPTDSGNDGSLCRECEQKLEQATQSWNPKALA
jgi:predicted amidophosphoribosyltransferase